jgi:hypothetical protein
VRGLIRHLETYLRKDPVRENPGIHEKTGAAGEKFYE